MLAAVSAALWTAVQTGLLKYGSHASVVLGSVAIATAAAMPSLLPRPPGDEKPGNRPTVQDALDKATRGP